MAKPDLICPGPQSTPAEAGVSRSAVRSLPADLLKEASNRLSIISLLAAILWVVCTILGRVAFHLVNPGNDSWSQWEAMDAIAAICVVVSVGLFFYARHSERDPKFILDLGLVYMVFTAAALGLVLHWAPLPEHFPIFPMITWLGAIVLMFAAIVPNSPAKTLVAGLLAVSMNPLGMLIVRAQGIWDFGPTINVLVMHYPDYLLVGVAVVISHAITRLGNQVTKAREMGSYELVTILGKGGMGEVWRARHRMLTRDAAIKLIHADVLNGNSGRNSAVLRRRFEQEAKTTASLRSPHTVQLYDFGISESGVFYYVMELLNGLDLETLVKKFGPQPPARVAYILRQVCRSLDEAHHHGIIHRDIKPTNIFLCRMGNEYDFVKVLDFGLVKVQDSSDTLITLSGSTTGTPAYMAPELATGRADIDGRTDLYGLGCVAYWLTTGKLVFEKNGSTAMMLAHVQEVPVPPSERTDISIPASLERAILMCLEKEPAQRPASAALLGREFENSSHVGSWTLEDAEHWWHANMPQTDVRLTENIQMVEQTPSATITL